ncbi:MAG: DUF1893 domain-containing protein [Bacteroidales bacterium]|nr:DUF1893 domain-containing protein [Bacteroidales bacterium]
MATTTPKSITRRTFLKVLGSGTIAMSAGMAGCAPGNDKSAGSPDKAGEMTYRTTPSTGDRVSLLGYGCMRWPTKDEPDADGNNLDQEQINTLVDYALEHGVNYFDTSPVYCRGFSEKATGIALSRHPRNSYFIATKMSNFSNSTFENSVAMYHKSMEELQTDYIDYYLLHSIGGGDDCMALLNERFFDNGLIDFLLEERKAGRIRNLGFSFHGDVKAFDYMLSVHDKYHWDFVQIQLNYMDWLHAPEINNRNVEAEYLYNELTKRGIPSVVMEPLLGGRLAKLNDQVASRLSRLRPNDSMASWAFRFAGSLPMILTVLSGMTYMEHLQENIKTYSPLEPCTDDELHLLEEVTDIMLHYPTVPCTTCQYCMPCPYGIDIPGVFSHYNKCIDEGNMPAGERDAEYERARKAFLVGYDRKVPVLRQASHCIGCGECEPHCPQRIEIPKQLHRIDNFVETLKRNDADLGIAVLGAQLMRQLDEGELSLIVAQGNEQHTFKKRGVRDLYNIITSKSGILKDARVADRVVGKGAAVLLAMGGAKEVFTHTISEPALELLKKHGIAVFYDTKTDHIINQAGTDWCPVEKRLKGYDTIEDCWPRIQQFISDLDAGLI